MKQLHIKPTPRNVQIRAGYLWPTLWILFLLFSVASCGSSSSESQKNSQTLDNEASEDTAATPPPTEYSAIGKNQLPADLVWLTNETDPVYASSDAKPGGTFRMALLSYPMTFRTIGPDSNGSFAGVLRSMGMSLTGLHPNTLEIVPELATHWAFGIDKRSMYFMLNPKARWSDGTPVTAADFAYTVDFMRSKHIVAPWYNDFYTKEIERVVIYDDHTLGVIAPKPKPDLFLYLSLSPTPRHFYGQLDETFVQKYNWSVVPNTGPYYLSDFKKGRSIKFKRKPDWWARDLYYYRHRFNVDQVTFEVVRDFNIQWQQFRKNRTDVFGVTLPKFWHVQSKSAEFEKGYIHKIWFYNDSQQSAMGLWLNQDREIFSDQRLRHAFAHAMNVEAVIQRVLRGDYYHLEHGYMGYGKYSHPDIRARRFDIDRVAALMTDAGWQRGPDSIWAKGQQRFSVEVTYGYEEHTQRLVVLKEEAKRAGIEIRLQRLDPTAAFKKFLEKKHDVAWMGWSTSLRPRFWEGFHSINAHKPQTNNITNTDNPELSDMIDAYRNALDAPERLRLALEIQAKLHEIGPFVPTFMVPYVRQAYWRWWRLPEIPGTKSSGGLFDPFDIATGGLFWFDQALYDETQVAMKAGRTFEPVTRIEETYKMKSLKE